MGCQMQSRSTPFFLILAFFLFYTLIVIQGVHAVTFPQVTTYYIISGERCYGSGGFTAPQAIKGELAVTLIPITGNTVKCESVGYLTESLTVENRQQGDGNYTPFFINLPASSSINITTFAENVVAQCIGDRYVEVGGKSVYTYLYCYVVNAPQSILRFEWYFDSESGVLLRFYKSITLNFVTVQWEEYMMKNTTLELVGAHPITALFTNIQTDFVAIVGAVVIVILSFYFLTQKKLRQGEAV